MEGVPDLVALSDAELTDRIVQLHAISNAIDSHMLAAVAEYDRREAWKADGATSMESWLVGMLGLGRETAREKVRVARGFCELPHLAKTYADGGLSWDQTRAVTEFATPETDPHLAREAPKLSASHLRRIARRFREITRETAQKAIDERSLEMWWNVEQNRLSFRGDLPAAEGALFEKAIDRLVHRIADHQDAEGGFVYKRACADALIELASVHVGRDPDPDRATVAVHIDASVLSGMSGMAEIDGKPIAMDTARRLFCDSRWYLVADGPDGAPLGIGRTSRQIPPALAREVKHRDGGCRFPGCERCGWINIHHIVEWGQGGPTDLDNLVTLCGPHHRLVHEGKWRIVGNPNGTLSFHAPDGRWFEDGGPPPVREDLRDHVAVLTAIGSQVGVGPAP